MKSKLVTLLITLFTISTLFSQNECFEFFYDNGNPLSIECYNDKGERINTWKFFFDNKQLKREETYKNNNITGEVIVYFRDGNIHKKIKYSKKGKYRVERIFNKQGKKVAIQNYSYYKEDGKWIKYYEKTQKIQSEANYKDGKKNGKYIIYAINGIKMKEENYKDGKLHGKSMNYYKNGNPREEKIYNMNVPVGKYISYYENGIVKSILEYGENRKILNLIEANDSDGNPLDKGTLKDGNGVYYEYDNNGKIKRTYEVVNGNRRYKKS
ncbi:hypothetical protein GCM10011344_37880 [Dokdonia pacifica]|uniref:Antitoxin component YwqK of the YwqJK toxin-antitoxin module n=1 Tax=Dokdonia pacifica TaxID=1627892 RepID=A0A239B480_9FLAO|nr:hypothetical protein [Dokdonia pacifica]GGG33442.1 hypothetical protein GCM10011344_37880 [Dokdonia pacifica]SNS02735.1 Antitoxin component YwqK of the YwqJK toxin-antitoxin module [Dokdonia pacifica]